MGLDIIWFIGLSVSVGLIGAVQVLMLLPRPYRVRRWLGGRLLDHEHEYTHNPGDGYFYCALEECNARKKLGGM